MPFSRRQFLELLAASGLAATGGVALIGCNSNTPETEPTAQANGDGSFSLALETPPAPNTAVAFLLPEQEPALLFQTKTGELSALSAVCTHSGCTVEWTGEAGKELHCPCHDSIFSTSGKVQSGPAKKPLTRYTAQFADGKATIKPA